MAEPTRKLNKNRGFYRPEEIYPVVDRLVALCDQREDDGGAVREIGEEGIRLLADVGVNNSHPLMRVLRKATHPSEKVRYRSLSRLREALLAGRDKTFLKDLTIPGFRRDVFWMMALATFGYLALIVFAFSTAKNFATLPERVLVTITVFLTYGLVTAFAGDWLGMRKRLPLCGSDNDALAVLGNVIFFAILFLGPSFLFWPILKMMQ